MSIDAMKLALEALEGFIPYLPLPDKAQCGRYDKAITALRAAIEQSHDWDEVEALRASLREHMAEIHRLRQWQGLTDDEIAEAGHLNVEGERMLPYSFARAIEAKLREKNNG